MRFRVIALLAVGGLLLPLLSPWSSSLPDVLRWPLDLVVHWQLLFTSVLAISGVCWAFAARSALVLALLPLCALPWLTGHSHRAGFSELTGTDEVVRVASANLHFENDNLEAVLQWLEQERVDVAVLLEVSIAAGAKLAQQKRFPHMLVAARDDPFGMAIVSREPLSQTLVRNAKVGGTPVLEAVTFKGSRSFRVVGVHPMPPLSAEYVHDRDAALSMEARAANESVLPTLIAGDLNATVWSSGFDALSSLGWRTVAPLPGTWHAGLPAMLGIGIDHILVDHRWRALSSKTGPSLGSDHRAVLAEVVPLESSD